MGNRGSSLVRLIAEDPVQEARIAAVRALAAHSNAEIAERLVAAWKSATPAVRREIMNALLRQPDRLETLLDELDAHRILLAEIDPISLRQLENHARTEIRERVGKLLRESVPEERRGVLARYQQAVTRKGDALRGRSVFQKNCATCHKVGDLGVRVGPEIADRLSKGREALLVDILNPNQAIDGNYINYMVSKKDGMVLNGLIATETASSVTLVRAEMQTEVVLRQDIDEMRISPASRSCRRAWRKTSASTRWPTCSHSSEIGVILEVRPAPRQIGSLKLQAAFPQPADRAIEWPASGLLASRFSCLANMA